VKSTQEATKIMPNVESHEQAPTESMPIVDLGPAEPPIDLETLVGALWSDGGTVPFAIASAIAIAAADLVRRDRATATAIDIRLEALGLTSAGELRSLQTGDGGSDPLTDVGMLLWELLVGRRFHHDDLRSNGDLHSLVATCTRERIGAPLGSLERRALSDMEPLVARAISKTNTARFTSLGSFVRALDAVIRPASPLRVAEWMRVVVGPRTRAPLVTPSPPAVRPHGSKPRKSGAARSNRPMSDTSALSLLEDLAVASRTLSPNELLHTTRTVAVEPPWWNVSEPHP
jgi:hypothetical protein